MSTSYPTVLTVDPGFAELGYAVVEVHSRRDVLLALDVVTTKPTAHKGPLKSEDQFRRLREQAEVLWALAQRYKFDAVCFESISLPQKASMQNAVKIGHPYGALGMLAAALDVPVVMCTPQAVKQAVCGAANASKEDVEDAMRTAWGHSEVAKVFLREVAETRQNHGWDALAAYAAAGRHDVMKAVKRGAQRPGGQHVVADKPGRRLKPVA